MRQHSMRCSNAFAAALASLLLLLPYLVNAVTLKDFTPRIDPDLLSSGCAAVYLKDVDGCIATDFTSAGQCSQACVASLLSLNDQVFNACSGSSQSNKGIIGAFLSGKGLTYLCPNSPTTVSSSSSVTPTSATSTINIIESSSSSSSASSSSITSTTTQSSTSDTSTSTDISTTSDSSTTSTIASSTSSPTSMLTTTPSANSTNAAPTSTEGPYNPPPNLPPSGTGAIPTPTSAPPAAGASVQPVAQCVPSGGGGSLIGNHGCASTATWTVRVEKSWLSAAMFSWLSLVFQLYQAMG